MATKRAFFILGPESSGTKMMAEALVKAGAWGDYDHGQRLDDLNFEGKSDTIMFRRSLPHAGSWPSVAGIILMMEKAGYEVIPIVMSRDREIVVRSQLRDHQHAKTEREARYNIVQAYTLIDIDLDEMNLEEKIIGVNYDTFVIDPQERKAFFEMLGLKVPKMRFYDGNRKYHEHPMA